MATISMILEIDNKNGGVTNMDTISQALLGCGVNGRLSHWHYDDLTSTYHFKGWYSKIEQEHAESVPRVIPARVTRL
jgi:hypothetical protein